ncbi:tetratricopeptide repeat protein [Candidatus Peregrinibacteria bacterium]|nr:tetratricopeptide repeat protein [Candidatus Peregrinibacteria bacterium]
MTAGNLKTVFTSYDPELYIPLTFVSYQINYMMAGLSPWIYHLTNILLHAGNALLVMWIALLLARMKCVAELLVPAIFAGMLFAAHPLNTEAVAWLAGRKDLLSAMFFLSAWIGYIGYRRMAGAARGSAAYWASVILFLFGLLSKVIALTLPAVLLLTDILIERRKWSWKILIDKIPYAALSGVFTLVAVLGKERIIAHHSITETALMAARSTAFYLQKFLMPVHLGVFYPYRGEINILLPAFLLPAVIIIALIACAAFCLTRRMQWMTFGVAFFLTTLAPTFINFHKGSEMYFASDRYPYLPMVGLVFLLMMAATQDVAVLRLYNRFWMWVPGVGVIAVLTTLSFFQTKIWDSPAALFGNTLKLYPESVAARDSLAAMDRQTGRYERAIKLLRDGLAYGDNLQLRMGLGTVYAKIGRVEDAADQFLQALKLEPGNPEPLVALGVLDEHNGKISDAMEKYRRAVEIDPSYVSARNKLGSLLLETGKTAEAEEQFRAALEWNPNTEGVLFNLSLILDSQRQTGEALELLERAYALSADDPRIMSALAEHLLISNPARARGILEQILRMDAGNQDAKNLLKRLQ